MDLMELPMVNELSLVFADIVAIQDDTFSNSIPIEPAVPPTLCMACPISSAPEAVVSPR
ncbi:hypothetical protein D3C74_399750 [compost metagenome]